MPSWFLDERTPKQQSLNLTVTALDDVLMKIEVRTGLNSVGIDKFEDST